MKSSPASSGLFYLQRSNLAEPAPFDVGIDNILDGGLVLGVHLFHGLELCQQLIVLDGLPRLLLGIPVHEKINGSVEGIGQLAEYVGRRLYALVFVSLYPAQNFLGIIQAFFLLFKQRLQHTKGNMLLIRHLCLHQQLDLLTRLEV